jgi:ribonuclease P protein component
MIRLERDIDVVLRGGKRLKHSGTFAARFALRELPAGAKPLLFLFIVPKRFVRRAHERNQIKRWLREALIASEAFQTLTTALASSERQFLVSIRVDKAPSATMNWNVIHAEVESIVEALQKLAATN